MASTGGAKFVPNIALMTGIEVVKIIWKEEINNTKAPINIQNSRELILSSLSFFDICLQLKANKTIDI